MNNDRRHFLDGSTAPRKPLPVPLTEGAMKAAMEDWLEALPKPAVKEFFGVQKKFPNPKDKKTVDAKNLEILKKYKVKPLIGDPSHRESLGALSCCLDMLVGGQGESVEVDGDQLNELQTRGRYLQVDPKASIADLKADRKGREERKSKKVYGMHGKVLAPSAAAYFKQHPRQRGLLHDPSTAGDNKYEEVTTEAKMIKYPADLEHKNHRDMTPAEKQRWIAYNRAYNQAVQTRDFSGIETSPSLGTKSKEYQDAWKAWNKQRTKHAANRDFHLIKPFVAPKEKTKKEEVTTEAKDTARLKHNAAVLRAAGGAKAYQAQKMAKRPILDKEISEFVERLSAKQIILLKKLLANGGGVRGGYQGGNQIGNDYPGQYGNQGGNQIGNY